MDVDLSKVHGLDTVIHEGYCHLGLHTLSRSACQLPLSFLRGTGTPKEFITAACGTDHSAISYATCFIVSTREDEAFVKQLYSDLQSNSVLCHIALLEDFVEHEDDISQSIVVYDKFLPVISERMMIDKLSHMLYLVEKEALAKEQAESEAVLLRLYLDQSLETRKPLWVKFTASLRWQRYCDFTQWPVLDKYRTSLNQLLFLLRL